MDNKEIFIKAFSQLDPLTDNETMLKNVKERAEKMNTGKRISFKKPLAVIAAAVLTVTAATISVGAATDWDYFGVFGQIFGKRGENIKDNVVPEATVIQDTIDTMDFEIVAAAADKHSVMTIIDVYPENDFRLIEETEHGTIIHPVHSLHIYYDSESMGSSGVGVHILEQSEEKVRLGVRLTTDSIIKDEKLTIYAALENKKDENGEYAFDTDSYYAWSAEFTVSYTGEEIRYEEELTVPCTIGPATVTGIEISSISAYFEGEHIDNFFGEYSSYDKNYVLLDSGERVIICGITASAYEYPIGNTHLTLTFAEPINPEEAASIVIGDNTIELK